MNGLFNFQWQNIPYCPLKRISNKSYAYVPTEFSRNSGLIKQRDCREDNKEDADY